mmetsp:Transcript_295/g.340  ORF Transcript_295/g.340 Transcript_295/m.340 type:complete len:127 (+) Transcript_295:134-514(+)
MPLLCYCYNYILFSRHSFLLLIATATLPRPRLSLPLCGYFDQSGLPTHALCKVLVAEETPSGEGQVLDPIIPTAAITGTEEAFSEECLKKAVRFKVPEHVDEVNGLNSRLFDTCFQHVDKSRNDVR